MAEASKGVLLWWAALSAVSLVNIAVYSWFAIDFARSKKPEERYFHQWRRLQVLLSGIFVFGCAFRSFLPRTEAERLVLYDSWISAAPIARIVATVAELAFVAQVALALHACARSADSRVVRGVAWSMTPAIALAELFSWYSATTGNFIASVFEESIWAVTFTLAMLGFAALWGRFEGEVRRTVTFAILIAAGYVVFMCTVDIPMYWHRWLRDQAAGGHYFSWSEGWADSWSRRVLTRRWEDWRPEMPWMSLYFSFAVWVSIAMTWSTRLLFMRTPDGQKRAPGRGSYEVAASHFSALAPANARTRSSSLANSAAGPE
ncbi:MAG TPA: hypothetical protein VH083_11455 [Myxococcales bacterium]|jgi:hypothetical protein|nr:hypothetical protein [Myxococcales bacterium]